MIKQRIMVSEIPEVNYIRYMTSHNSSNIHGENLHIWAVEQKKIKISKTKIYFHEKNYNSVIRTYRATKIESRSESKFWVTCRCLPNESDISS